MKILAAEFVTSVAGDATGIPRDGVPQIALAGRSNVGKSSLINALCGRTIARTSAAPGKTRLANVYRVTLQGGAAGAGRRSVYLVDLPGYGYARGGADAARELALVAKGYFAALKGPVPLPRSHRGTGPLSALLIVDARHPGLELDIQAYEWLKAMGVEPYLVATKIDKLSRTDRARNLTVLGDVFGTAVLPVSAEHGEGLDELWRVISTATTTAG